MNSLYQPLDIHLHQRLPWHVFPKFEMLSNEHVIGAENFNVIRLIST